MTNNHETDTLVLIDEEGMEIEFEFVGSLDSDGNEYVVLSPLTDDEEMDEIIIFKIEVEDGEEFLLEIEDDEEWEKVADLWSELSEEEEEEE